MLGINKKSSESSVFETDIERISREVKELQSRPEYEKVPEKEIIKEVLQSRIKQVPLETKREKTQPIPAQEPFLPEYLKNSSPEIKAPVKELVAMAFSQGISKAVISARQKGAFFLDAFLDALRDKLYEELKKRKMI